MGSIEPTFLASFWTIAGPSHPLTCQGVSVASFEERVEAAAAAGYVGLGFLDTDLAAITDRAQWPYRAIRRRLEQSGLDFVELEVLTNWFASGEERKASDSTRAQLLEAATELGANHIKVVGDFTDICPVSKMADSFAALCEDAAKAGTTIAIELTPLTNLSSPEQGLDLIRASSASNAGLLLDVWQIGRANICFESLAAIPSELIVGVELSDADAQVRGSLMEDTMRHRRLPGEGVLEPARLVAAVHEAGYRNPYGIEIISDAHRALPVREQARVAIASAREQIRLADRHIAERAR